MGSNNKNTREVPTSTIQHEDQVLAERLAGAVPPYEHMQDAILGMCGIRKLILGFGSKLCNHELFVKSDLQSLSVGNRG